MNTGVINQKWITVKKVRKNPKIREGLFGVFHILTFLIPKM